MNFTKQMNEKNKQKVAKNLFNTDFVSMDLTNFYYIQ